MIENKETIKRIILEMRLLFKEINKYNIQPTIHLSVHLESTTNEIMEVNPFVLNLLNGSYFGRDLIDGKYKHVKFW